MGNNCLFNWIRRWKREFRDQLVRLTTTYVLRFDFSNPAISASARFCARDLATVARDLTSCLYHGAKRVTPTLLPNTWSRCNLGYLYTYISTFTLVSYSVYFSFLIESSLVKSSLPFGHANQWWLLFYLFNYCCLYAQQKLRCFS